MNGRFWDGFTVDIGSVRVTDAVRAHDGAQHARSCAART